MKSLLPTLKSWQDLSHFIQMVVVKALLGLKSEFYGMRLSYAWVIIEPLLHLGLYYVLFGEILNAGIANYGLFLLSGLVPWLWFSKSIASSGGSILSGQGLMLNCSVSPAFFPLVALVRSTLKQLLPLTLLLMLGAITTSAASWVHLLYLPVIVAIQFALIVVMGCLVAAAVAFVRDLAKLLNTGLMMLMLLSGVIHDVSRLSPGIARVVELNPMTWIIRAYRDILLEGHSPPMSGAVYIGGCIVVGALVACLIYRTQRNAFVKRGMV